MATAVNPATGHVRAYITAEDARGSTPFFRSATFPIYSYTDLGYPNAINGDANLSVDDRLGVAKFLRDIGLNPDGSPAAVGPADPASAKARGR